MKIGAASENREMQIALGMQAQVYQQRIEAAHCAGEPVIEVAVVQEQSQGVVCAVESRGGEFQIPGDGVYRGDGILQR